MNQTIILLTGPQGSGKTTLVSLMQNAKEFPIGTGIDPEFILKKFEKYEKIVITCIHRTNMLVQILEEISKKNNLNFLNINLTR